MGTFLNNYLENTMTILNTSKSLNYIIIGLLIVVIVLAIIIVFQNKK